MLHIWALNIITLASAFSCVTAAIRRHINKAEKLAHTVAQPPDAPDFEGFSIGRSPCRDANRTTPLWVSNSPMDERSQTTPEECKELCDRSWKDDSLIFRCAAFMIGPADPDQPGDFVDCTLYADATMWDRLRAKIDELDGDLEEVDAWLAQELGLGSLWGTLVLPTKPWGHFSGPVEQSRQLNRGYPCYIRRMSLREMSEQAKVKAEDSTRKSRSSAKSSSEAGPVAAWAALAAALALL